MSTVAGSTTVGYVDGIGTTVKFRNPIGLVVDSARNVWILDHGNNMIRKIDATGKCRQVFALYFN